MDFRREKYVRFNNKDSKLHFLDPEYGEECGVLLLDIPAEKIGDFNSTVTFTDIDDGEYGLYNFKENNLYLFGQVNGRKTGFVKLPAEVPDCSSLRFSFANGHFWLLDADKRIWLGSNVY